MTREELIEAIVEATFSDVMTVPKDEKAMRRLAKRGTLGHIGHGALRFVGGNMLGSPLLAMGPLGGAGQIGLGVGNVLRYSQKVEKARQGKHRGQEQYQNGEWA